MSQRLGQLPTLRQRRTIPGTQVLSRAVAILHAFTDDRPQWTLSALAAELGMKKSTTHRILSALEGMGFLSRVRGGGGYRLGPELIVLGAQARRGIDLLDVARPELRHLAETTGENATVESLIDGEVLILHEERGGGLLSGGTETGTRWPVHATATGKVLMAFRGDELPEPPEGLLPITRNTIVSWDRWLEVLSEVREMGYATNIEEIEYGYASVAVPVRDETGRTTASISIGGPFHRVTRERIPSLTRLVLAAAARISEQLGYRGGPV